MQFEGKRRSPLEAVKAFCRACMGCSHEVKRCPSDNCALHAYRSGKIEPGANRSIVKAIKAKCQDCLPGEHQPKDCSAWRDFEHMPACSLWPFRMGRNPNITPEQRRKLAEHGRAKGFQPGQRAENASRIVPGGQNEGGLAE